MDYNQFTYYRANPYARQGFMPPAAHTNRHQPSFLTEMPMGEQHLAKIGKKFFGHSKTNSNIQQEQLLKSPERYPFENRIALDKNFERNLNTIDIEGATSGTLLTQGVRNKLKARQELIRRQKNQQRQDEEQMKMSERLAHLDSTEEDRRRQVAYQQYLKNQKQQEMRESQIRNEQNQRYNKPEERPSNYHQAPRERQVEQVHPRYQSLQMGRPSVNPEDVPRSNSQISKYSVESQEPMSRYELRQQNPTNLSYNSQIYRAGRSVMGN